MKRLYAFVDESGSPASGDYFTIAACWVVSTERLSAVLRHTQTQLLEQAESIHRNKRFEELKGSKLDDEKISQLLSSAEGHAYADDSLIDAQKPWRQKNRPLRFTVHNHNPEFGAAALESVIQTEPDRPKALQLINLASVLSPIGRSSTIDKSNIDEIKIIYDADTWADIAERYERGLRTLQGPRIKWETPDSKKVPGLQIADLAAYSWARALRGLGCRGAAKIVDDLCFSRY